MNRTPPSLERSRAARWGTQRGLPGACHWIGHHPGSSQSPPTLGLGPFAEGIPRAGCELLAFTESFREASGAAGRHPEAVSVGRSVHCGTCGSGRPSYACTQPAGLTQPLIRSPSATRASAPAGTKSLTAFRTRRLDQRSGERTSDGTGQLGDQAAGPVVGMFPNDGAVIRQWAPSRPTCTTSGSQANAATSPMSTARLKPTSVLTPSPRSTAARRQRGSTESRNKRWDDRRPSCFTCSRW